MPTDPDDKLDLRTLAPQYNEAHHGIYVRALRAAIEDSTMNNVALTGAYGTGKSSVLSHPQVLSIPCGPVEGLQVRFACSDRRYRPRVTAAVSTPVTGPRKALNRWVS